MESVNKHLQFFQTSAVVIFILFIYSFSGCSDDNPPTQVIKYVNPVETRIGYIGTGDVYNNISVIQCKDGGYAFCSTIYNENNEFQMFVAKLSADYQTQWSKEFGLPDSYVANDLVEFDDGSIAVAGNTFHYYSGGRVICVVKVSQNGALLWSKSFNNGSTEGMGWGSKICKTQDNCMVVLGSTDYDSGTDLLKIDQEGALLWTRNCGDLSSVNKLVSSSGGFTAANGSCIVRLGADGAFQWCRHYTSGSNDVLCNEIFHTSAGDFIVAGSFQYNGYYAPMIFKTDDNGNILWAKAYGPSSPVGGGAFRSVNLFLDGGYIAAGFTPGYGGGGFYMKFSEDGAIGWAKSYDTTGLQKFDYVFPVSDGGISLIGESTIYGNNYDIMVKCNKDGNACENIPAYQISATSLTLNSGSYIYTDSLITLNPSNINMNISEANFNYNLICKY